MRILLTNDDGWHAPGIRAAKEQLDKIANTILVAPSSECSATSHAITITAPLRVDGSHGNNTYSVDGKPADCVKVALGHLLDQLPDLVVSGINRGANLGIDTLYSGTVAGALEGAMANLPAIAISSCGSQGEPFAFDTASSILVQFINEYRMFLKKGEVVNLNVPNLPLEKIKGFKKAKISNANYETHCVEARDPRGRPYYWFAGGPLEDHSKGTDISLVKEGYVSVSILKPSLFCEKATEEIQYLT